MVTLNGSRPVYAGTSTDEKGTDVMVNSIFLELDTGFIFYFDENDGWQPVGDGFTEQTRASVATTLSMAAPGISPVIRPTLGLSIPASDPDELDEEGEAEEAEQE